MNASYKWSFGNGFWRVWCAMFGHRLYKARDAYMFEIGCERCKINFRVDYEDAPSDIPESQ